MAGGDKKTNLVKPKVFGMRTNRRVCTLFKSKVFSIEKLCPEMVFTHAENVRKGLGLVVVHAFSVIPQHLKSLQNPDKGSRSFVDRRGGEWG